MGRKSSPQLSGIVKAESSGMPIEYPSKARAYYQPEGSGVPPGLDATRAEVEATCLSVALAGLASRLGMVDREQNEKVREAMARREASGTSPVQP